MVEILLAALIFGYLISLLYVLPSYFRRLGSLIERLKNYHSDIYSELGEPSLSVLDIRMRSAWALVMFVLRKRYLVVNDDNVIDLGNAARWRLIYGMLPALAPFFGFAAMVVRNIS